MHTFWQVRGSFLSDCYNPLLGRTIGLGAGVEQLFDCFIVEKCQAMQFVGRSMDWTSEDNMVHGLFFCTTLTGCKVGHTPFV